jgi:hypothetical protein
MKGGIRPTDIAPILLAEYIVVPRLMCGGFQFPQQGSRYQRKTKTAREEDIRTFAGKTEVRYLPSTGFYEWDAQKKKYLSYACSGMLYMRGSTTGRDGVDRFVSKPPEANASMRKATTGCLCRSEDRIKLDFCFNKAEVKIFISRQPGWSERRRVEGAGSGNKGGRKKNRVGERKYKKPGFSA